MNAHLYKLERLKIFPEKNLKITKNYIEILTTFSYSWKDHLRFSLLFPKNNWKIYQFRRLSFSGCRFVFICSAVVKQEPHPKLVAKAMKTKKLQTNWM